MDHLAEQLGADLGRRLIECKGHVGELRRVPNDAAVGIAVDVRFPFP